MGCIRKATLPTVIAVSAVGILAAVAGCAQVGAPHSGPAAPSPRRSTPHPTPLDPPAGPPADAPPLGLDVRYLDEQGDFKFLRVEDFPR